MDEVIEFLADMVSIDFLPLQEGESEYSIPEDTPPEYMPSSTQL